MKSKFLSFMDYHFQCVNIYIIYSFHTLCFLYRSRVSQYGWMNIVISTCVWFRDLIPKLFLRIVFNLVHNLLLNAVSLWVVCFFSVNLPISQQTFYLLITLYILVSCRNFYAVYAAVLQCLLMLHWSFCHLLHPPLLDHSWVRGCLSVCLSSSVCV